MREIVIKKGHHMASNQFYGVQSSKSVDFLFCFENESKYNLPQHEQSDWNKMFGLSDLRFTTQGKIKRPAHINSMRLGWRFHLKNFQIGLYGYSRGRRIYENAGAIIQKGALHRCVITRTNNSYEIAVYKYGMTVPLYSSTMYVYDPKTMLYVVEPSYFGGNNPAPNKITYLFERTV